MFTKSFTYTYTDIERAFNLHYAKKHPFRSKLLLILGVFLLVAFIVLSFLRGISAELPQLKWLTLVVALFYIGFYFFRKKSIVKRAMLNPTLNQMESITIKPDGLVLKGKNGEGNVAYSSISDTEEDEYSFLLYFTANNFLILPKRLINLLELNELKDYLNK